MDVCPQTNVCGPLPNYLTNTGSVELLCFKEDVEYFCQIRKYTVKTSTTTSTTTTSTTNNNLK